MVVCGGQYGSEAKGAITAHLAKDCQEPLVVRVGGPNAGHTVIDDDGREWKLRHVPVGFVNPAATLALAPGSEVNPRILWEEISALEAAGHKIQGRMCVDPQATLLDDTHVAAESASTLNDRLGSTAKGVGAARADRTWRTAELASGVLNPVKVPTLIEDWRTAGRDVIIEGTQGFGLGLHAGLYPYCTSGDCRAIDFLAQCGVSPWAWDPDDLDIWVVFRTRPIRVAGNSGPLMGETTWGQLGLPEEYTTVTKRVRRVGEWDSRLAYAALAANGGPAVQTHVAITMLDQLFPEVQGVTTLSDLSQRAIDWLREKTNELGQPVDLIGTSPSTQVRGVYYGG
ncbi:MAG: adenylosuccinate synthetase [Phage 66_12]|jgi:adenylosuccinate synthase|nr:MAG: adenylosuccinate synthetase [Phage 66_12]